MHILAFISLVRDLRAAQKKYFKDRNQSNLVAAKQLEGQVDQTLKDGLDLQLDAVSLAAVSVSSPSEEQPALFGDDLEECLDA